MAIDTSKSRQMPTMNLKWLAEKILPFFALLLFVISWEIGQRLTDVPPQYITPLPSVIFEYLVEEWNFILGHLWVTLKEAGIGFMLGNFFAISLAIGCIFSSRLEAIIMPFALALRSIPIIAITPVLVFLLGVGWESKIAVAGLVTFFPTLVNMVVGLRSVDHRLLEYMHVLNATRLQTLLKIRLPSSLPSLFAALKIAVPSAILGAAIAEWINASAGIGYLIIMSTYQFNTEMLYGAMILTTAVTALAYSSMVWLEKALVPWRRKEVVS